MLQKAKNILLGLRTHWNNPPEGYFVPYKEVAGLSVGKFGYYMAMALGMKLLENGVLKGSNIIVSQALHVDPVHITIMNVIITVMGFWFTLIRSNLVDNSHNREGRFRPFMKTFGIPSLAVATAIVWFPFHLLPNGGEAISAQLWGSGYWMKVGILLALFLALQFFNPFYSMAYDNIIMVSSPNTQERLNIQTITTVVWGLAPTLYDILFYSLSGKFENSLADIRLFRYAYVPVCALGLAFSYVGYISSRERIVQSRAHYNQMTLRETFRAVGKNRNFWLLCASQWAGFLESNSNELLNWAYIYQKKMTPQQFTLADMLVREGAMLSYIITPPMAKRFGKRFLMISSNILNILLLAVTYNTYHIIPALVTFRFINFVFNCVNDNIGPALNADVRDAQHYISGERIDGMFNMVNYVGTLIGMGTNFVTPFIWRRGGIYEGNGAVDFLGNKSMWFALRDKGTYDRLSRSMIITSVAGAAMNVIPLFFYNLSEAKQRGMSKALKLRAMFEDYANGILKEEARRECAKIIREAREGIGNTEENKYVLDELNKYETPAMQQRLALAQEIVDGGYQGILTFDPSRIKRLKGKDKKDKAEKRMLHDKKRTLMDIKEAQKNMARFYPSGNAVEPDIRALDTLYDAQPRSRQEAKEIKTQIKLLEIERSKFHHSTKPFIRARQLLADRESAARLDEIFSDFELNQKQEEKPVNG